MNNAVTSEQYGVIVGHIVTINTDRPASFKIAGHRSEISCRLQLELKAANLALLTPARAINI